MRKVMSTCLALLLLLTMSGCRRRIVADSGNVVYETVGQPIPVPIEGEGQQVPDPSLNPDPEDTKTETDSHGDPVDETVSAEGGERVENGENVQAGEKITVTLDAMGGQCTADSVTVRVGGVYGVLPTPTLTGQSFQGWFLREEGGEPVNPVTVVLEEKDHTLYAHWTTKTEFVLTFDPNGGRVSPYSAQKTIFAGDVYGKLPEPMRSGYAFLGWFTEPEDGVQILPSNMVTVLDDQTVYAHWEYSPMDYWAFVLENTTQRIFDCQEVRVYLELMADRVTMLYAPLISDVGAQNIAREEDGPLVSDAWVKDRKPNIIVKLTEDMSTAAATKSAMERRFPGFRVYVFPVEAIEGSDAEQLYYKLRFASLCYPQYYYEMDMRAVARELGVETAAVG